MFTWGERPLRGEAFCPHHHYVEGFTVSYSPAAGKPPAIRLFTLTTKIQNPTSMTLCSTQPEIKRKGSPDARWGLGASANRQHKVKGLIHPPHTCIRRGRNTLVVRQSQTRPQAQMPNTVRNPSLNTRNLAHAPTRKNERRIF